MGSTNINRGQLTSIRANRHQIGSTNINQGQPTSNGVNRHQSGSTDINQRQPTSIGDNPHQLGPIVGARFQNLTPRAPTAQGFSKSSSEIRKGAPPGALCYDALRCPLCQYLIQLQRWCPFSRVSAKSSSRSQILPKPYAVGALGVRFWNLAPTKSSSDELFSEMTCGWWVTITIL